jgi:hypothetical protein
MVGRSFLLPFALFWFRETIVYRKRNICYVISYQRGMKYRNPPGVGNRCGLSACCFFLHTAMRIWIEKVHLHQPNQNGAEGGREQSTSSWLSRLVHALPCKLYQEEEAIKACLKGG